MVIQKKTEERAALRRQGKVLAPKSASGGNRCGNEQMKEGEREKKKGSIEPGKDDQAGT